MLIMDNRGKSWLIGQVQSENPVLRSCFGSGFGSGVARQELPRLFELTDMGLTRMEFKEPPLFEKSRGTERLKEELAALIKYVQINKAWKSCG